MKEQNNNSGFVKCVFGASGTITLIKYAYVRGNSVSSDKINRAAEWFCGPVVFREIIIVVRSGWVW